MLVGMLGERSEYPELWAFLESLHPGVRLAGAVAAIEPFGVFVALDDGPAHPVFPGVGFITMPELSWVRFERASDIVQVGQRVSCAFLQFDTWNLEARLSLAATQPDPFQSFADGAEVGQELVGHVTKVVPFGVFVQVVDGIEGLVPAGEFAQMAVGDELSVVVVEVDRVRRRLRLSLR
jgi:small subunit ribosomal protein S1